MNNPEDATKAGLMCVNTEDTGSGSAAQNKITAASSEQVNSLEKAKLGDEMPTLGVLQCSGGPLFPEKERQGGLRAQGQARLGRVETVEIDGSEGSGHEAPPAAPRSIVSPEEAIFAGTKRLAPKAFGQAEKARRTSLDRQQQQQLHRELTNAASSGCQQASREQ